MKSVEDIIKNLKGFTPAGAVSLADVLKVVAIENILAVQSSSSYRNSTLLSIIEDNLLKIIPSLEVDKIISQTITSESHVNEIKNNLNNQGLFSKAKIIAFLDFDNLKVKFQNILAQEIGKNKDQLIIIFTKKGLPKTLEKLKKISTSSVLTPFSPAKLEKWIGLECAKRGISGCEDKAIKFLISHLGPDKVDEIIRMVDKACLLTESNSKLTLKSILECSVIDSDQNMNDLFSAVAKKDILKTNSAIKSVLDSGTHPLQILSYFSKAIKTLVAGFDKSNSNEHAKDLHNPWFLKNLQPNLFSQSRLEHAIRTLSELEFGLKDNGLSHETILNKSLTDI